MKNRYPIDALAQVIADLTRLKADIESEQLEEDSEPNTGATMPGILQKACRDLQIIESNIYGG